MARALDKLMFTIGMIDKVSGPVAKVQNSIGGLLNKSKAAFAGIALGAAGLMGAGYALQAGMMPAIEMQRSLAEVESLGVHEQALDKLEAKALQFSTRYGESATEFVSASYDIQSAIAGLNGTELAAFTEASGVLAKATKADTGTITSYMGTMYGIFKNQAAAMGNDNWVKIVAGQTATAVQMFKTTGAEMSSSFTSLGANATSVGVAMNEQMAILGTLQATMSGSEAGTKYRAFLAGIDKAQSSLGMSFTDASGNILPMMDILEKLRGQYGDTLSVAEGAELSKAFGSQEAVSMIKLLMADTDGLAGSINQLGEVTGMDKAAEMADAMVDPWQRMGAGMKAVKIGMGSALLPVLNPLITAMADGAAEITAWTNEFPNLTRYIGIAAGAVLAIGAALATMNIVMGIASLVSAGFGIAMAIATSPVTLIVVGIALLVAAVVGLIAYWDQLKAAFMDTDFGKSVMMMVDMIISAFSTMKGFVGSVIDSVISGLNLIPGINIATGGTDEINAPTVQSLQASRSNTGVPSGGVGKTISNAINNNSARTVQIGKIETNQPAASIEQEMLMAGA